MTVRPLPRSRLGNLIPSLLQSQALVALVPATGNLRWAAEAAWDVARAAAQQERRVALVDLWVEDPALHEVVALTPEDGIVDAFEYGVSLTKAAHQVDGVFFIATGSYTAHPGELYAHPRWQKLQAGFRAEDALLLLYLSAGGLARLSATPDGVLVLSPDGFEPESSVGQGIQAALERGTPLLGVVRERWTPPPGPDAPAIRPSRAAPQPSVAAARTPRRVRTAVVAVTLAAGAAGGWALLERSGTRPEAIAAPAASEPRADSLAWTVQLAAYGALDKALAHAERLAAGDLPAFVTSVALPGSGAVWHRVVAGGWSTRDSAAAGREALWQAGVARRGEGDLLRAPYSLKLTAASDVGRLRRLGIPAVRPDAAGRVLVGAFETPEQASLTEAQLARAGIEATLVIRTGIRP